MTTSEDWPVVDPPTTAPLCNETEFGELVESMVADCAPRVFAVVQELGERVDGWIVAWGMAFDGHADVTAVTPGVRLRVQTPERALVGFGRHPHITTRLVWVNAEARTPVDST